MKEKPFDLFCKECQLFYKTADEGKHKAYHDAITENRPALERLGEKIKNIINPYY
jgi:hypothetical protein